MEELTTEQIDERVLFGTISKTATILPGFDVTFHVLTNKELKEVRKANPIPEDIKQITDAKKAEEEESDFLMLPILSKAIDGIKFKEHTFDFTAADSKAKLQALLDNQVPHVLAMLWLSYVSLLAEFTKELDEGIKKN